MIPVSQSFFNVFIEFKTTKRTNDHLPRTFPWLYSVHILRYIRCIQCSSIHFMLFPDYRLVLSLNLSPASAILMALRLTPGIKLYASIG